MNINSKCSLAKQLKRLIAVTCNWKKMIIIPMNFPRMAMITFVWRAAFFLINVCRTFIIRVQTAINRTKLALNSLRFHFDLLSTYNDSCCFIEFLLQNYVNNSGNKSHNIHLASFFAFSIHIIWALQTKVWNELHFNLFGTFLMEKCHHL